MKQKLFSAAVAAGMLLGLSGGALAEQAKTYRIAVSTFLSGAGAVFGVPAHDAGVLLAEKINKEGGIKGAKLELTFIEENQSVDNVVSEIRRLIEGRSVDAMIIGLSSSVCLAAAPVLEQLEMPTVFWDCNTSRIFEENKYKYIFRTGDFTPPTNIASALYMLKLDPSIKTIAGINQDYAFGRDNWAAFKATVEALRPDIRFVAELFPKLGTADYSTEISRLSSLRPDIIFSTLWGGDMNTFVKQASSRGLFRNSRLVAPNGGASIEQLGLTFPENAIVGVRGDSWAVDPAMKDDAEHIAFITAFKEKTGAYPAFPSYQMAQAMTAIQAALEAKWNGQDDTKQSALIAGLDGLEMRNFSGALKLREDHQALEGQLVGITVKTTYPFMDFRQVVVLPPELITPPVGTNTLDFIKGLKPEILDKVQIPAK